MVRKKCLVFGMALALLLTSNPMVSEAEEPGEGSRVGAELGAEVEEDAFAEELEALEAEARRQMMEEAAEREEEIRRQKEAQMAAEAERRMAEVVNSGEPGPEAGSVEAQVAGISWRVDGDTVVISGEGYVPDRDALRGAMAAAKYVRFEGCKVFGSMYGFFRDLENLESIDLTGLDTSQVTDMGSMFYDCSGLTSLDVSGFDTSQVTNMWGMFSNCSGLTSLDISGFETSQVTDMNFMFSCCFDLTSLDVSGFDTSQVTKMCMMFFACHELTSLDVSGFDTSQVTDMSYMFGRCDVLTSLDVSGFNTSQVMDMSYMFERCHGLTSLDVSGFNTSQVTDMGYMFSGCDGLTSLDVSSFDTSQVVKENIENHDYGMQGIFSGCDNLTMIKAFKVPPTQVTCDLPGTYADENGNQTTQITSAFAGKTLTRVSQDNPSPGPDHEESDPVRSFVSRMYTVALGRAAEEAGLNDWTSRLLNHEVDGAGIANGFIMSDEFKNKNVPDGDYVDIIYRTFFDREADEGGRTTWMEALANGNSRAYVLAGFVNSVEFDNLCGRYGIIRGTMEVNETPINPGIRQFVERCYLKVLGREGEKAGVDDWTGWIARGEQTPESAAKLFFFSEEHQNKHTSDEEFVETLYQTFMDRASDSAGKADWLGHLAGGMSREEVLEGFSRSAEFAAITESFGL